MRYNMFMDGLDYIFISAIIILLVWVIMLEIRLHKTFGGSNASSLEGALSNIQNSVKHLLNHKVQTENELNNINRRVKRSVQGLHTKRFNPFKDSGLGGNQSFVTAMLNENGDGLILTCIYSHEKTGVYAKPIKSYKSEYELTSEELDALSKYIRLPNIP